MTTPAPRDIGIAFGLEPRAAVAYLQQRGLQLQPSWNWWDVWQEQHADSFAVARVARVDVLSAIHAELLRAAQEGLTGRDFRQRLEPQLRALGWWGKQVVVDSQGGAEVAQLGSPWRLDLIYRQNLQGAYMAGRYQAQVDNAEERPYWQYVAILDGVTRPSHRLLHGRVYRWDDPIWQTHYPPCDYGCRCRVRALSERQLAREGLQIGNSRGQISRREVEIGVDRRSGEVIRREVAVWTDPVSGNEFATGPGFAHNPGQAQGARLLADKLATAPAAVSAAATPAWEYVTTPDLDRVQALGAERYAELVDGLTVPDSAAVIAVRGRRLGEVLADPTRDPLDLLDVVPRLRADILAAIERRQGRGLDPALLNRGGQGAAAVTRAARKLPRRWVEIANAAPLRVKLSSARGHYHPGKWNRAAGAVERYIQTSAGSTAEHEYVHHLQYTVPGLDELFQAEHRRRTAGQSLVRLYLGEEGRPDGYVERYQGKEYPTRAGGPGPAREVITMALQAILGEDAQADRWFAAMLLRDPGMVRLALGALLHYRPGG